MSILLVNYEYPPIGGGAANATYFLGREFARMGDKPVVVTAGLEHQRGHAVEDGVDVHRLPCMRHHTGHSNTLEMIDFMRHAWKAAPDIVRAHDVNRAIAFFTIPSGPVCARLQTRLGIPYLVFLRGGDVPGHVPGLWLQHAVSRPMRRWVLRNAAAVVANGHGLARRSEMADPFPVHVIPNGVDADLFHPPESGDKGPENGATVFLYAGRMHREKNLDMLLDQLAGLDAHGKEPSRPWKLLMAGDGDQRAALQDQTRKLGIGDKVEWTGWMDKKDMPALLRRAHCFVNPSQYEGLPNAVQEAMATGLPVIASNVPGNAELVDDGRTGWLFDLTRPDDLGRCLVRALQEHPGDMGKQARHDARTKFTWAMAREALLALFPPA